MMDRKLRFGILALVAVMALVAIGTLMVAADPADITKAPTEDWIFDEGKTTVIQNMDWTIRYNITVTNGSVLKIEDSEWIFNSSDPWGPAWIMTDVNTSLFISSCAFVADEGTPGYFIEAHDNLTLTGCVFIGLSENFQRDAGITVYGNEFVHANLTYVTVYETMSCDGVYLENCQVDIANCQVNDTEGNAIVLFYGDNDPDATYWAHIIDSEMFVVERGIVLRAYTNYAQVYLDCYNVDVTTTKEEGVSIDVGDHTNRDYGNGSVYCTFDQMNVKDIGDQAFYFSTLYQVQGLGSNTNIYNVSITNTTIEDVTNTGMYVQLYYSVVDYNMIVDNVYYKNISMPDYTTFDRLGGIFWWFYYCTGSADLYVSNCTFDECNDAGIHSWENSNSAGNIHVYSSEFVNCTLAAIYIDMDTSSATPGPVFIENCWIHDNEGYGLYRYMYYLYSSTGIITHVTNSTVERNGNVGLKCENDYYGNNIGLNVTNCIIRDHDALAIDVYGYYVKGTIMLHIINTTVENTGGCRLSFPYDYTSPSVMDIQLINSSILNSTGTALSGSASIYYSGVSVNMIVYDSVIRNAGGDGISISIGRTSSSSSYVPVINSNIDIANLTIDKVGGIAVSFMVPSVGEKGIRAFTFENAVIQKAQRGFFNMGFSGDLYNVTITGSLKEDIILIGSRMNVWYCTFTSIDERKFKAYEGGELYFYWDMQILVKWDTGAPAVGANVLIFDNKQTLISVRTVTSPDGSLEKDTMNPFFVRETGIFAQTPYVINVTFLQVYKQIGIKLDKNLVLTIILEDHYDPEIFILYPKEGHIQQSTTLLVRGSAWDSQSGIKHVLVSLDGDTWWPARGSLRWNITIEVNESLVGRFSGVFLLRAKAVDNAENEKLAFVQIRVDPTPPELTIDFPYHGYRTNNPDILVRGVTELGSTVEINSQPVPVVVSMFSHWVHLVEGPNTITVISIDPLGNIQIVRMTITLDTQKPYVILINPEDDPAMTNEDHITIEAQVEDELEITVNGYEVKYDTPNYPKGAGLMTYELLLEQGENVVVVQARDKAGNLLVYDFVVVYDTIDPWIQVISPTPGTALPKPEVTIIGTVDPTATLKIEDEDVTVYNGFFERTILAYEGFNEVEMEAEDAAGNVYLETLEFYVDTEDPVVAVSAPMPGDIIVNEVRYIIEGTTGFEDNNDNWVVSATEVLVNGEPYTLIDDGTGQKVRMDIEVDPVTGDFSIPVDLLQGKNEFVVTAVDPVDRTGSTTHVVRLDTVAPTLVMYIDPIIVKEDTIISHSVTVNITGYTDPGSILTVNGILLPVNEKGEFKMPFDLAKGTTTITLVSIDSAQNERTVSQAIEYKPITEEDGKGIDWGFWIWVIILIVLIIVIAVFMTMYVRRQREEYIEISAAEATPILPVEELETVVEEPDTLPGPDEISLDEEEVAEAKPAPTTAPPRPRPRAPQQRRPAPVPVPRGEKPEVEEKDLSEKDAEADIGADETDQEGI